MASPDEEVPLEKLVGNYLDLTGTLRNTLLQKKTPGEVYQLAHALLKRGKTQDSFAAFRTLLQNHPEFPNNKKAHYLFQLGHHQFLLKDFPRATESFFCALQLKNSPQYAACLAWAHLKQGSVSAATAVIAPYQSQDSQFPKIQYLFCICHIAKQEYPQALELMHSILAKDKDQYVYWCVCGVLYAKANQPDDAFECFMKCSQLSSSRPECWYNLSVLYHHSGQHSEAAKSYAKALSLTKGPRPTVTDEYQFPELELQEFLSETPCAAPVQSSKNLRILRKSPHSDDKNPLMNPIFGLPLGPIASERALDIQMLRKLSSLCQRISQESKKIAFQNTEGDELNECDLLPSKRGRE